jgi:RNA polymerase sigma-70 factor (ECF subfamily)
MTEQQQHVAFEQIVEQYADFAYNVAYRVLGNPEDARDAVQDAFISAYRNFGSFRQESKVTTWLYRIVVNASLMKLRKDKRSREMTAPESDEPRDIPDSSPDPEGVPEGAALNRELREHLQRGLAQLPEDLRVAVVLRDVQGLSNQEAAEVLETTVSAFKARLHRGRVQLRAHLEPYLQP